MRSCSSGSIPIELKHVRDILNKISGRCELRNRSRMFRVFLCAASLCTALAQLETATLTGVITDPAGAVVANAGVKAVNEETNIETSVVTNVEGRYVFPSLRPG